MMLAQHYSNTGSAVYLAAAPQQNVPFTQLGCLLSLRLAGDPFPPLVARKATTQITRYIGPMVM